MNRKTTNRIYPFLVPVSGRVLLVFILSLFSACSMLPDRSDELGRIVSWSELPGWDLDLHAEVWPALQQNCNSAIARRPEWAEICQEARLIPDPSDEIARIFFESRFFPVEITNEEGSSRGLITGYYEPLLHGSLTKTDRYRYPIYRKPDDLLRVDLGELYPELAGKPVRARVVGSKVVPYFSREQIDNSHKYLAGNELLWVDDPIDVFFLHIQGSGRVVLADGRELAVGYIDQNGHPYNSIGAELIRMGAIKAEDVSMQTIRDWLKTNPDSAEELLQLNPSYIFFEFRDIAGGPIGSLNVPLTPERSMAVDRSRIPLGLPIWVDTTLPDNGEPYRRLMFAQDTGGAIKGAVRADVFFGRGELAEHRAGYMKQEGKMYVLKPRIPETVTQMVVSKAHTAD